MCVAALPAYGQTQKGLTGTYQVLGLNPDRSKYEGLAKIVDDNGQVTITWFIGGTRYSGTGQVRGNVLTIDWGQEQPVIYDLSTKGKLDGIWAGGRASEYLTLMPEG